MCSEFPAHGHCQSRSLEVPGSDFDSVCPCLSSLCTQKNVPVSVCVTVYFYLPVLIRYFKSGSYKKDVFMVKNYSVDCSRRGADTLQEQSHFFLFLFGYFVT